MFYTANAASSANCMTLKRVNYDPISNFVCTHRCLGHARIFRCPLIAEARAECNGDHCSCGLMPRPHSLKRVRPRDYLVKLLLSLARDYLKAAQVYENSTVL